MRKTIAIILFTIIVITLTACGNSTNASPDSPPPTNLQSSEPIPNETPTEAPEPSISPEEENEDADGYVHFLGKL